MDTSRFVRLIADYMGLSTGVVNGYLIGEHGDGQVPVWSRVTIGGIPVGEYCENVGLVWDEEIRGVIAEKTRGMGGEIIRAKGKTHYGIATCVWGTRCEGGFSVGSVGSGPFGRTAENKRAVGA